jgi:nitroimidazol reductase NimA-like FMN-containing flavoprotein (pyridoxamine 5'-phosphate oxidase superfamily)
LIRRGRVGRLAFCSDGRPEVVPVNYLMTDGQILVSTERGAKLDAARRGDPVAFEIDHLDPVDETAWSIVVHGRACEVTDRRELETAERSGLHPWVAGVRPYLIGVTVEEMTGRRIGHSWTTA